MTTERDLFRSYGPTAATDGHALAAVVEQRIDELLRFRRWYRANRWAEWTDLRRDDDRELRALVRLARRARRIAREAYPTWTRAADGGWTESELRLAAGDR